MGNQVGAKIKLEYDKKNKIFCDSIDKMTEIYVIDSTEDSVSFYGCKMVVIDKKLEKIEGVFIFCDCSDSMIQDLAYTFKILQKI